MSPKLADVLKGQIAALTAPLTPEDGGDYLRARIAMVGVLAVFAAQEAERGVAARVFENEAIAALLASAPRAYDAAAGDDPETSAAARDLTLTALDARNADLRRRLIRLHEAAEARGDHGLDREIIALYGAMAHARRLDLPGASAG